MGLEQRVITAVDSCSDERHACLSQLSVVPTGEQKCVWSTHCGRSLSLRYSMDNHIDMWDVAK